MKHRPDRPATEFERYQAKRGVARIRKMRPRLNEDQIEHLGIVTEALILDAHQR